MRKMIFLLIVFSIWSNNIRASNSFDFGLNMGGMIPYSDTLVRQSFGKDFFVNGFLGIKSDFGFELKANLGSYSTLSYHPLDIGTNLRLQIIPLTGDFIFHIPFFFLNPYFGAGGGAYFYNVSDNIYGNLTSGTQFGYHLIAGFKIPITSTFYLNAEYNRYFIPPILFKNASNFNSHVVVLGTGFYFPIIENTKENTHIESYRYSLEEENLLLKIQQIKTEISEMESKRNEIQQEINAFYKTNNYNEEDPEFKAQYLKIQFLEKKVGVLNSQLENAKTDLTKAENTWGSTHLQTYSTVQKEIIYLENHYAYSPYGLNKWHGYFIRPTHSYSYRYYQPELQIDAQFSETSKEKQDKAEQKKQRLVDIANRTAF